MLYKLGKILVHLHVLYVLASLGCTCILAPVPTHSRFFLMFSQNCLNFSLARSLSCKNILPSRLHLWQLISAPACILPSPASLSCPGLRVFSKKNTRLFDILSMLLLVVQPLCFPFLLFLPFLSLFDRALAFGVLFFLYSKIGTAHCCLCFSLLNYRPVHLKIQRLRTRLRTRLTSKRCNGRELIRTHMPSGNTLRSSSLRRHISCL